MINHTIYNASNKYSYPYSFLQFDRILMKTDAEAAVNKSLTHVNFGPEEMLLGEGSGELRIYDNQGQGHNATMVNVTIKSLEPFVTESVYLSLQLNHTSRGHLMIKLTAPSTYNAKQQNLNYPGLLVVIHISIAFVRPSFLMSFFSLSSIHHIFYGRWEIFDSISRIPTGGSNK